jgi:uracil-DNA glycosylase
MQLEMESAISNGWQLLAHERLQPYFRDIERRLSMEPFYPAAPDVMRALELTSPDKVSVVILGQDPYHGAGQATGLAFAVHEGERLPPSLRNIYRELADEYPGLKVQRGADGKPSGELDGWAAQGILLLNTSLTVHPGEAGSHSQIGWQHLTGRIVEHVSEHREHVVFVLWGAHAQSRRPLIDETRHTVIATAHPSPLSARRGFFGSDCFKQVNQALHKHGQREIDWASQARWPSS